MTPRPPARPSSSGEDMCTPKKTSLHQGFFFGVLKITVVRHLRPGQVARRRAAQDGTMCDPISRGLSREPGTSAVRPWSGHRPVGNAPAPWEIVGWLCGHYAAPGSAERQIDGFGGVNLKGE